MAARTTLFVIVAHLASGPHTRRVRRTLRSHATELNPNAYEFAGTSAELHALQGHLAMDLTSNDTVRIYPVCARCRVRARAFGTTNFATVPTAYIF